MEHLYDPTSFQEAAADSEEEVLGSMPTRDALDMFKQQVSEWTKLDNDIRKLSIAIRERRVHQRALGSRIQDFMIKYGYDDLNTQAGKIRSNVRMVKQPVKLGDIREKLMSISDLSGMTGEQLLQRLFDDEARPLVEKRSLRRVIPKVSLSLDI